MLTVLTRAGTEGTTHVLFHSLGYGKSPAF
jgi:hypothetical protein